MARRVNTTFVIGLVASVGAIVGVVVCVVLLRWYRNHDPATLQARGEAAEKAGRIKEAVGQYGAAANELAKRHKVGADLLYMRYSELAMKVSASADNESDAVNYYRDALRGYAAAAADNPLNRDANEKLLDLDYQNAMNTGDPGLWVMVDETATRMIKSQDGAKPRAYRAQARLTSLQIKPDGFLEEDLKPAEEDIQAALQFDPNNGLAVAQNANLMLMRARLRLSQAELTQRALTTLRQQGLAAVLAAKPAKAPQPATAPSATQAATQMVSGTASATQRTASSRPALPPSPLEQQVAAGQLYVQTLDSAYKYLDQYLGKNGSNSDVAWQDGVILYEEWRIFESNTDDTLSKVAGLFEQAISSDASKRAVYVRLNDLYMSSPTLLTRGEAFYRQLIKLRPNGPEAYYRLGEFYRKSARPSDAVAAYKDALAHSQIGGGQQAALNDDFETESQAKLAEADMSLAETTPEGLGSDKAKAFMKDAADYTEKLRAAHASRGIVALLDGRSQLINHNVPQAMQSLQEAEGYLNGGADPDTKERLVEAKMLRAQANQSEGQYGKALDLVNDALQILLPTQNYRITRESLPILIVRAQLDMQAGEYMEAEKSVTSVVGEPHIAGGVFDGTFANEESLAPAARQQLLEWWATAAAHLGQANDAKAVLNRMGKVTEDVDSILQLATAELAAGDNAGGAADARRALETKDKNTADQNLTAYRTAIVGLARDGQKDEAHRMVADAVKQYPDDPSLVLLNRLLASPDEKISADDEAQIWQGIKDPFARNMRIAQVYHGKNPDKEIKYLQAAENLVANGTTPADRDRMTAVVDNIFNAALLSGSQADAISAAALEQAKSAATPDARTRLEATAKKQSDAAAGYWNLAQGYAQKAEKLNLDGAGGKLYRGRMEFLKSHGKDGIDLISQVAQQRPDFAAAHLMLGLAYSQSRDNDDALAEFRKVIKLSPSNTEAMRMALELLVPHRNAADASVERQKEAKDIVDSALRIAPNDAEFQDYADVLLISDADLLGAINRRESEYRRNPDDLQNVESLASLYRRWDQQHPSAAAATPGEAVENQPESREMKLVAPVFAKHPDNLELASLMAQLVAEKGDTAQAEAIFDSFASSSDTDVKYDALIDRALLCKSIQRIDDAVTSLNEAIKIQPPNSDEAQRVMGDIYFEGGRFADAVKVYRGLAQGVTDEDSRDKILRRMVEAELDLGNFSDASSQIAEMDGRLEAKYKKNPEYKGDLVELLLLQALSDFQQKQLAKVHDVISRVLTIDPNNANALYQRAEADWVLGDKLKVRDSVLKDLAAARATDRSVRSRQLLAQIYTQSEDYGEASVIYEEAIAMQPDAENVRLEYMRFLFNLVELQKKFPPAASQAIAGEIKQLAPADRLFKQIKEAEAHFPDPEHMLKWWLAYLQLMDMQGGDTLKAYNTLYQAMPDNDQVGNAYLAALLKAKDFDNAVAVASKRIDPVADQSQSHPEVVEFYLKRAAAYRGQNKPELAAGDIDKAFAIAAQLAITHQAYDLYLAVLNQATETLPPELLAERLKARVQANPGETISQVALMQSLLMIERPQDAAAVAEKITPPANDPTLRALALREAATALYMAKKYDDADKDFTELVEKVAPMDISGLNNFAFMLADGMGKPKEGIKYAQQAIKALSAQSDPNSIMAQSAMVYDTLGWAQYLDGQNDVAIITLRNSLAWKKQPAAYLHLGTALLKAGQLTDAEQAAHEGLGLAGLEHDQNMAALQKLEDDIKKRQPRQNSNAASE